jgi:hypothetical protein
MKAADEAASNWGVALEKAGRLGAAVEKLTVEAPLISLQLIASAVQGDLEGTSARLTVLRETIDDARRLESGAELGQVAEAGTRLAQSTMGRFSLRGSADEERLLADPAFQLARELSENLGSKTILASRVIGMAMGGVGLLKGGIAVARSLPAALAAAKGVIAGLKGAIKGVAGAASKAAGRAIGRVSVHGGRASQVAGGILRGPSEIAGILVPKLPFRPPQLTLPHRLSRLLITATKDYPRNTPVPRLLKKLPGMLGDWEQSHLAIQGQWYRAGSKFALFPEGSQALRGLQALGNAGFNLAPLPTFINQGLRNSPWLMSALGLTIQGGAIYGGYRTGRYVYEGVREVLRDDWSEQPDGR